MKVAHSEPLILKYKSATYIFLFLWTLLMNIYAQEK